VALFTFEGPLPQLQLAALAGLVGKALQADPDRAVPFEQAWRRSLGGQKLSGLWTLGG
jgi:hypothetical protein